MMFNHIAAIAYRDLAKFLRDPIRVVSSLIFPVIFVGVMGRTMDANLGENIGFDFQVFIFTGIYAQTLFESSTFGVIWLIEDRENDFSQEIFVSPVSRYSIILGKIFGESLVAMAQGASILVFGAIIGINYSLAQLLILLGVGLICCLLGGSFGVAVLANLSNRRAVQQLFPFIMLPQYFLGGIFAPVKVLPWYLEILSRISPVRYAADLTRGLYYRDLPDASQVVLTSGWINLAIIAGMFALFLVSGTAIFVRSERNR